MTSPGVRRRARLITLIGLAAVASPLGLWSANTSKGMSFGHLTWVVFAVFLAGLALGLLVSSITGDSSAFYSVAVGVVVFSYFGMASDLFTRLGGVSFLALGCLIAIAAALASTKAVRRWRGFDDLIFWILVAITAGPLALGVVSAQAAMAQDSRPPNVAVVFLDGYAGAEVLNRFFDHDNTEFERQLTGRGFEVVPDAKSSYSMTYASIASILAMDYEVEHGARVDGSLRRGLYATLSGSNAFVDRLREAGYHYVHIESGWGGTACGPRVDTCIGATFLDDATWHYLQRTALAGLMKEWKGHSFTQGGLHSLAELGAAPRHSTEPFLVVAHVLLPHPPLLLDEQCTMRYDRDLDHLNVMAPYIGDSTVERRRLQAYVEQLRCLNDRLLAALDELGAGTVVAIIGDHGTDGQGQLTIPVTEWDEEQIAERLDTILAIKGCGGPIPEATINALRFLSSCVTGDDFHPLDYRRFLVPVEENHPGSEVIGVD